jgi:DNA polymerase III sliding clamp (beta) subunit (PCNA family)
MITFSHRLLREALAGLRVLKVSKQKHPPLQCVAIRGIAETLTFEATNLDEYLSFEGRGETDGPGAQLVPYELLQDILKSGDANSTVTLTPGSDISYSAGGARLTLPLPEHKLEDFPPAPTPVGGPTALPPGVLASMVEAQGCASTDASRYILNSVFLTPHEVVSTDGRQMYRRNGLELSLPEPGVIFPLSGVPGVLDHRQHAELTVWDLDQTPKAMVAQGPWRWVTRLIVGNYPNFRQVIPRVEDYGLTVTIGDADATRLISVLPRLPGFKESSSPVVLTINAHGAVLSPPARLPQVQVALDRSEVTGTGDKRVQFNATFLVAALKRGFRELGVRDAVSPLVMRDASRVNLWMPVRMEDPVPSAPAPAEASPEPVQFKPAIDSQPQPEPTMVAIKTTTPEIAPVVTPAEPAARTEAPVNAPSEASPLDTLQRAKDLLRELNTALTDVSTALRDLTREKRGVERDLESLKRNLRVLKAVEV